MCVIIIKTLIIIVLSFFMKRELFPKPFGINELKIKIEIYLLEKTIQLNVLNLFEIPVKLIYPFFRI